MALSMGGKMPFVCSIYGHRSKFCRDYPEKDSHIPDTCGFYFTADGRKGGCRVECDATCCRSPREDGEPLGRSMSEEEGGESCKYIQWVDEDQLPEERKEALHAERSER